MKQKLRESWGNGLGGLYLEKNRSFLRMRVLKSFISSLKCHLVFLKDMLKKGERTDQHLTTGCSTDSQEFPSSDEAEVIDQSRKVKSPPLKKSPFPLLTNPKRKRKKNPNPIRKRPKKTSQKTLQ